MNFNMFCVTKLIILAIDLTEGTASTLNLDVSIWKSQAQLLIQKEHA